MKRKKYRIEIDATQQKVWDVLWNDTTYRQWVAPFYEGSYAETDWKEGSDARFLAPNGSGMYSKIIKSDPPNEMHIKHMGVVNDGQVILDSEEAKKWQGAIENYTLKTNGKVTVLEVETDIASEYVEGFDKVWPLALEKIKQLSEK